MKLGVLYYLLAVAEGMISGTYFYKASKREDGRSFSLFLGALWFLSSFLNAVMGGELLREEKNEKGLLRNAFSRRSCGEDITVNYDGGQDDA